MKTENINLSINKTELRSLYKTNPYKVLGHIALEWLIIITSIAVSIYAKSYFVYILSLLVIGARMHGLAIIMHDVSHHRFFKNRILSDKLMNILFCYPVFISLEDYRKNHLSHHSHLNTENDPDWKAKVDKHEYNNPKNGIQFFWRCFLYMCFYQGLKDIIWILRRINHQNKVKKAPNYELIIFQILTFSMLYFTGTLTIYFLYWIVPFLTTFMMFQYIRSFAEHFGDLEKSHSLNSSRSVKPTIIENFFISPYNVHFHIEHHLYPAVPYYNLPKLNQLLLTDPQFEKHAHYTTGYFKGFIKELSA